MEEFSPSFVYPNIPCLSLGELVLTPTTAMDLQGLPRGWDSSRAGIPESFLTTPNLDILGLPSTLKSNA